MRFSRGVRQTGLPSAAVRLTNGGKVSVVGVPMDLGAGHRGVDMGPSSFQVAGLNSVIRDLGYDVEDLGNVPVPSVESIGEPERPDARYLTEIAKVCGELAHRVNGAIQAGRFPITLGGDHAAAVGSVSGTAAHFAQQGKRIGCIWVDAHTDMNTPDTSPSGNVHGMPMAALLGHGPKELTNILRQGNSPHLRPENCAFIGIRDVDKTEFDLVHSSGVHVFTMEDVDFLGAREVMRRAIEAATQGTSGFHFSFDMDGVDPEVAPGVGTPVSGGLSFRESHLLCEIAASSEKMIAMDVMETNPALDIANKTARFGVELILSALGRRILNHSRH